MTSLAIRQAAAIHWGPVEILVRGADEALLELMAHDGGAGLEEFTWREMCAERRRLAASERDEREADEALRERRREAWQRREQERQAAEHHRMLAQELRERRELLVALGQMAALLRRIPARLDLLPGVEMDLVQIRTAPPGQMRWRLNRADFDAVMARLREEAEDVDTECR